MPSIDDIKYVPPPSVGHEIGVAFGFLGAMAVSMALYVVGWQWANRRGQRREAERIETLKASGWLKEKQEPEDEREEDAHGIPTEGITTM